MSCRRRVKEPFAHTFSIVAIDPENGDMGVAVQSHWFSVGNTVAWGEAGVGVVATQAVVNVDFGPLALGLLKKGKDPQFALDFLLNQDPIREMRQVAILDRSGRIAVKTGKSCVGEAGDKQGKFYSVQANTADNSLMWPAMGKAFEDSTGTLAEKMIAALEAGQGMGGDVRGMQSASLLIVKGEQTDKPWLDKRIDLRVDDHKTPIEELKRLYKIHSAYDAVNLGYYYLNKNELDMADGHFKIAKELYPENEELVFWYAIELANKQQIDRALPIFKFVFGVDKKWKEKLLDRIVAAGVLTVDKKTLNLIKSL